MTSALSHPRVPITQVMSAVLQLAAMHHNAGRRDSAAALYKEVLALDPRHSDALFLLGVLERQAGRWEEARALLREAARWAARRARIDSELQLVERLIASRHCMPAQGKPVQPWQQAAVQTASYGHAQA